MLWGMKDRRVGRKFREHHRDATEVFACLVTGFQRIKNMGTLCMLKKVFVS